MRWGLHSPHSCAGQAHVTLLRSPRIIRSQEGLETQVLPMYRVVLLRKVAGVTVQVNAGTRKKLPALKTVRILRRSLPAKTGRVAMQHVSDKVPS